jgi:hypothetical protein
VIYGSKTKYMIINRNVTILQQDLITMDKYLRGSEFDIFRYLDKYKKISYVMKYNQE